MTRSRRPGVGTAACWVVAVRGGSAAGRQRLTELLPCSHSREALPGHRRGHLLARQRVPPQAHSPEELSPSASCQDLATGLPGLPYSPPRPWPLGVRSNSPGCGMAAGGARAQRGTGVPGDRAGPSLPQAAASPRCPPPPHPPSAGQEQPCWLGCRLPGTSGQVWLGEPSLFVPLTAVAATRTTPPARGPGLSGPGGHGRVTAGQTERVGCFLARKNGQLFAGACGRDRNCPCAEPAGGREERAIGVILAGGVGSPTFPSPRGVTPRAGGQHPPPLPASGQGAVRDAGPDRLEDTGPSGSPAPRSWGCRRAPPPLLPSPGNPAVDAPLPSGGGATGFSVGRLWETPRASFQVDWSLLFTRAPQNVTADGFP